MLVILGVLLGAAAVLGPVRVFDTPGTSISSALLDLGATSIDKLVEWLGNEGQARPAVIVAAVVSVALPGLVTALLVALGKAGGELRRAGAALSVIGGLALIVVERSWAALAGGVFLIVFGVVLSVAAAAIISISSGAVAGFIAAAQIKLVWAGNDPAVDTSLARLEEVFPAIDPGMLHGFLVVLAALPFGLVAFSLLHD